MEPQKKPRRTLRVIALVVLAHGLLFATARAQAALHANHEDEQNSAFESLDRNGDGTLQPDEIRSELQSMGGDRLDEDSELDRATTAALSTVDRYGDIGIQKQDMQMRFATLSHMTVKDVEDWVSYALQLPQYAPLFRKNAIRGPDLATLLNMDDESWREFGVLNKIHRNKLMREVKALILGIANPPQRPVIKECTIDMNYCTVALEINVPEVDLDNMHEEKVEDRNNRNIYPIHMWRAKIQDAAHFPYREFGRGTPETLSLLEHLCDRTRIGSEACTRYCSALVKKQSTIRVETWNTIGRSKYAEVKLSECAIDSHDLDFELGILRMEKLDVMEQQHGREYNHSPTPDDVAVATLYPENYETNTEENELYKTTARTDIQRKVPVGCSPGKCYPSVEFPMLGGTDDNGVDAMFSAVDLDGDDEISQKELQEAIKIMSSGDKLSNLVDEKATEYIRKKLAETYQAFGVKENAQLKKEMFQERASILSNMAPTKELLADWFSFGMGLQSYSSLVLLKDVTGSDLEELIKLSSSYRVCEKLEMDQRHCEKLQRIVQKIVYGWLDVPEKPHHFTYKLGDQCGSLVLHWSSIHRNSRRRPHTYVLKRRKLSRGTWNVLNTSDSECKSGSCPGDWVVIYQGRKESYEDTELEIGSDYSYELIAWNDGGQSFPAVLNRVSMNGNPALSHCATTSMLLYNFVVGTFGLLKFVFSNVLWLGTVLPTITFFSWLTYEGTKDRLDLQDWRIVKCANKLVNVLVGIMGMPQTEVVQYSAANTILEHLGDSEDEYLGMAHHYQGYEHTGEVLHHQDNVVPNNLNPHHSDSEGSERSTSQRRSSMKKRVKSAKMILKKASSLLRR